MTSAQRTERHRVISRSVAFWEAVKRLRDAGATPDELDRLLSARPPHWCDIRKGVVRAEGVAS